MARDESGHEDLIATAQALSRRVELQLPDEDEPIVAGFHKLGHLSLYFGGDSYFQFDSEGRLRRAFVGGRLYRTQGTCLAELERVRSDDTTELRRRDLTRSETEAFLHEMRGRLLRLRRAIEDSQAAIVRQVPANDPILPDILQRLIAISGQLAQSRASLAPAINVAR